MLFKKIEKDLKNIIHDQPKIILGLSGGPDSVFLFHFLNNLHKKNKITLIAVHLDHEWRKESHNDVTFCQNLCNQENIQFISEKASNIDTNLKYNGSHEEIGRKLRRTLFQRVLIKKQAQYIALAHHLQDQQETFVWRIIRGSSLTGLCCMKKLDPPYFRPLLNINKTEILEYLQKNKLKYLEDKTNSSDLYLRNRIRKYVIPAIQNVDTRFNTKFQSTLRHLNESEEFLQNLTQNLFEKIFIKDNKEKITKGNLKDFLNLDKILQKRLIITLLCKKKAQFTCSENYIKEILRFLNNGNGGSHKICNYWKIYKKKSKFWLDK